ncbi:MAG: endo-1,4-beta-xylanase [Lachnospiraceae bacterium]|nr:endo-1,4-beta-xylanase [Lachnospiraceae bacterium]
MANEKYAHRKSEVRIRFTDREGKPLTNTDIQAKLTDHEFLFGCGAFDFIGRANPAPGSDLSFVTDRTDKWLQVYNYGTLPFYLGSFEPVEGKPDTEKLMNTAKFLRERNVTVKGHPLCWHTVCADWLMEYDNRTVLEKLRGRIHREVEGFKGIVDIWDVINEVVIMPVFDKYDNAVTRLCNELGRVGIVKEMFAAAKESNPDALLLINDFNTSEHYAELISDCLDAGVPIGAIGIQSHQHQGYWGKEKLLEVLERFERFGLPIHFTENTLVSGDLIPPEIEDLNDWQVSEWPGTPEGEERQARETEEIYRILFDHPLVKAVTGWDFADGAWLGAPSGVVHKDNTEKPVYRMLKDLIRKEWTTDVTIHTDEEGFGVLKGFRGRYRLSAKDRSAEYILSEENKEQPVIL